MAVGAELQLLLTNAVRASVASADDDDVLVVRVDKSVVVFGLEERVLRRRVVKEPLSVHEGSYAHRAVSVCVGGAVADCLLLLPAGCA